MKLEEIRKFPKLKYATNIVTCLDLDLVIALHDNMTQIDIFSFSTGKAIFKYRMKRHNTIVDIRVDRIKKWLFVLYHDSEQEKSVTGSLDLVDFIFDDWVASKGIDMATLGMNHRSEQYAIFSKFYDFTGPRAPWYPLNLETGEFEVPCHPPEFIGNFMGCSRLFWFSEFERVQGHKSSGTQFHRMSDSGLPTLDFLGTYPAGLAPAIQWDDQILAFSNEDPNQHLLVCLNSEGDTKYKLPVFPEEKSPGDNYLKRPSLSYVDKLNGKVLASYQCGYQPAEDYYGAPTCIHWFNLVNRDSGILDWNLKVEVVSRLEPFVTRDYIVLPDRDGITAVSIHTGEVGHVAWPNHGDLNHVKCLSGQNESLYRSNRFIDSCWESAPRMPYFFWQEERGKPMSLSQIVE